MSRRDTCDFENVILILFVCSIITINKDVIR